MYIKAKEVTNIGHVGSRYANMCMRFLPLLNDFEQFIAFIKELHCIRQTESMFLDKRLKKIREVKDTADATHCNLVRFFQYRSVLGEFHDFWRSYHQYLFSDNDIKKLTDAYAAQPLIKCVEFGIHLHTTARSRGNKLLRQLENNLELVRITFANGEILEIPDLNQHHLSQEEFQRIQDVHKQHFQNNVVDRVALHRSGIF